MSFTKGYRVPGTVVNLTVAANAGALAVFQVSDSALQIGTKSFKLVQIRTMNNGAGNTTLQFGIGAAGVMVATMPLLNTFNGLETVWLENEIPDVEYFEDLMCFATLVGGGTHDVQVTVLERG